jgi:hypothetical protein
MTQTLVTMCIALASPNNGHANHGCLRKKQPSAPKMQAYAATFASAPPTTHSPAQCPQCIPANQAAPQSVATNGTSLPPFVENVFVDRPPIASDAKIDRIIQVQPNANKPHRTNLETHTARGKEQHWVNDPKVA